MSRKILHIDMDCFYAAIEIRDNPSLADKPVAVGASPEQRGVICTANYIARQYGVRSAMATATALRQCKDLILLPVNMSKYRAVAKRIHAIFYEYTTLVEPLSLDEAYLDVSNATHCQGSATLMAKAIRERIWKEEQLTASAGVAPNKFLAKVASGWKKPNGLFVIQPHEIENFVKDLSVNELFGVGKVTAEKLHQMNLKICSDLQQLSLEQLMERFGKLGKNLYQQCRGQDERAVQPNRERKSLSVERTFPQDVNRIDYCLNIIKELYEKLLLRMQDSAQGVPIKNQFIKIKFNDFKQITAETTSKEMNLQHYVNLFSAAYERQQKPIRLLGLGVHFNHGSEVKLISQSSLF